MPSDPIYVNITTVTVEARDDEHKTVYSVELDVDWWDKNDVLMLDGVAFVWREEYFDRAIIYDHNARTQENISQHSVPTDTSVDTAPSPPDAG